jgi:hypothetical protein
MNNETRSKIAAALRSAAAKLMAAEATDVLFSINETLNPDLWDENKKLKPEVKQTLQEIADDFADGFDYPLDVTDVIVTGSSANYNWNRFSDVDLHLVVDYDAIPESYMPAFLDYADAKRKLWNQEHNIELFGHEVEVYVQPEQGTLEAAGVYSLMKDEWLAEPKRQEPKADKATVEKKAARFIDLVDAIQEMLDSGDDELAFNSATILKDRIRKFRQSGLEKGGEFAAENLVFKTLRNDGTLERLDSLHKQAYDQGRSLSAAVEPPSRPEKGSLTSNDYAELIDGDIEQELNYREEYGEEIVLRSRPDQEEAEQLLKGELGINPVEFDDVAWKVLLKHIPTALMAGLGNQLGRGIPEDIVEEAYSLAVELWMNNGGYSIYMGAIGSGISIKDQWYREAPDELSLDVLWRTMAAETELRHAAHNLENAIYNAASVYVDQHGEKVEEEEEEEEVQRGPDTDTVVYRYAGNNSTIAGASSKGMYVADLSVKHLKDESRELGHCIGNPQHGHPQLLSSGTTRVFSIRTESGRSKFSIEQFVKDGKHPQHGAVKAGTVTEVKGKPNNRLPGFDPGSTDLTKPDEVRLVVEFLMKYLGLSPSEIEATHDIRGGVMAMQAMGQDPFSPPPKKAERPKRDPRALEAAVRLVKADYQRVAELHAAPVPIFEDEGFAAIDHLHHVKEKVFSGRDLIGQTAAVRLDIPSSWAKPKGRDAVVVTIHDPSGLAPVGYDHSAVVQNATFRIRPGEARAVATGERNKTPFSYVQGTLTGAGSVGQLALPNGIPVYYDPRVVHLYVNALTGKPLKAASEVNFYYVPGNRGYFLPEIDGVYIWAKNPEYYAPGEAPGADPRDAKWGWAMTEDFALTKTPSKVVLP